MIPGNRLCQSAAACLVQISDGIGGVLFGTPVGIQGCCLCHRSAEIIFFSAFRLRVPSQESISVPLRDIRLGNGMLIGHIYCGTGSAFIVHIQRHGEGQYLPSRVQSQIVGGHGILSPVHGIHRARIIEPAQEPVSLPLGCARGSCHGCLILITGACRSPGPAVCRELHRIGVSGIVQIVIVTIQSTAHLRGFVSPIPLIEGEAFNIISVAFGKKQ